MTKISLPMIGTATNTAVVVLGMHRSGTSLLSGILDKLGCRGPKTPIETSSWNEKGFYESQLVCTLNDEILAAAGSSWDNWSPLSPNWHASPRFNEFRDRIREVVRSEFGQGSLIYLKDPRLCRLFVLWREVLEDMAYRVVCVHTHRSPTEVAQSLQRRNGIEPGVGALIWLRYCLEAEAQSRGLPRLFTNYTSILESWPAFTLKAEESFGFPWPALSQAGQDIDALVDRNLRHHASDTEAFLGNPLKPEFMTRCLGILERWSREGESEEDRADLDHIRAQFDLSVPLFHPPIRALKERGKRLSAEAKAKGEELAAALLTAKTTREQLEQRLDRQAADLAAAALEVEAAVDLRRQLAESQGADAAAMRALEIRAAEAEAKIEDLQQRLERADANLAMANEEIKLVVDRVIERDKIIGKLRAGGTAATATAASSREIEEIHRAYRTSTSWRISAPVRVVGDMLRRVKGKGA